MHLAPSSWNHLKLKERVSLDECKAALNDLNAVKSVNVCLNMIIRQLLLLKYSFFTDTEVYTVSAFWVFFLFFLLLAWT